MQVPLEVKKTFLITVTVYFTVSKQNEQPRQDYYQRYCNFVVLLIEFTETRRRIDEKRDVTLAIG